MYWNLHGWRMPVAGWWRAWDIRYMDATMGQSRKVSRVPPHGTCMCGNNRKDTKRYNKYSFIELQKESRALVSGCEGVKGTLRPRSASLTHAAASYGIGWGCLFGIVCTGIHLPRVVATRSCWMLPLKATCPRCSHLLLSLTLLRTAAPPVPSLSAPAWTALPCAPLSHPCVP